MTDMTIKVIHIVLGLRIGGLEKMVVDLVRHLKEQVQPSIVCLERKGQLSEILDDRIPIYELNKRDGYDFNALMHVVKIAKRTKVDIIHTHNPTPHLYGVGASLLARIPLIHTKHGRNHPSSSRKVFLNRLLACLTRKVVAVSRDAAVVCTNIEKINHKKVVTIYNGIDTEAFRPFPPQNSIRGEYGIEKKRLLIGIVARLSPEKDHATLIMACKILKQHMIPFTLLIVGDGPSGTYLKNLVQDANLGAEIFFTGMRQNISEILNEMDIFVLSSTTEGISLTLLEAMACEVPVVATDVGGNPEVVIHGVTGFLVPPKNPEALAESLMVLYKKPDLRAKMGKSGRERVLKIYSLSQTANQYTQLYREILSHHRFSRTHSV